MDKEGVMSGHFRELALDFRFAGCSTLYGLLKRQEQGEVEDIKVLKTSALEILSKLGKEARTCRKYSISETAEEIAEELRKDYPDISAARKALGALRKGLDECIANSAPINRPDSWPDRRKKNKDDEPFEDEEALSQDPEVTHF